MIWVQMDDLITDIFPGDKTRGFPKINIQIKFLPNIIFKSLFWEKKKKEVCPEISILKLKLYLITFYF